MSFKRSVIVCLSKYIDFNGRSSRTEFWWFQLFVVLVQIPFGIVLNTLDTDSVRYDIVNVLSYILAGALFLPNLSVTSRRLHDVNKSGWLQMIPWALGVTYYVVSTIVGDENIFALLTILGAAVSALILLFWLVRKSDDTSNAYGDPVVVVPSDNYRDSIGYNDMHDRTLGNCTLCGTPGGSDHVYCIKCGAKL